MTKGKFKVPIYDFIVEVFIFDDIEEAKKEFEGVIEGHLLGCTIEYIDRPKCKLIIPCDNISTVVHELEHIKNLIWKYIGYTPQTNNDEVDAYLITYLLEQTEKYLKKHLASRC